MTRWRNSGNRYGIVTITFHWITLALVVLMVALGVWMEELPEGSYDRFQALQLHKSVGITLLLLTLTRLLWRLADPPIALAATLPDWQKRAARLVHWGLYLLLMLVPLAGWATASASTLGLPIKLYGALPWPDLPFTTASSGGVEGQKALEHFFHEVHEALIFTLIALILVHALAALWHQYADKDGTLSRILPGQGA